VSTPAEWPAGVNRRVFPALDSTNAEALRIGPQLSGPTWLLALEQTTARGRRGRAWYTPAGSFAATLVIPGPVEPLHAAQRSFVAALALLDACVAVTGQPDAFALKWPNDVLLHGAKLAGILLETLPGKGGPVGLCVGIGVNLATAPAHAALEAQALTPAALSHLTGDAITPETFLSHLAPAFARHQHTHDTYGFAPIRTAWLARAARLGQPVTARMPGAQITGTFDGLEPDGALRLSTPDGPRSIAAADIFF
jgi:BirA family biotin operon repressor/biotin-[acetyl-CoA-carboxylase] ligase